MCVRALGVGRLRATAYRPPSRPPSSSLPAPHPTRPHATPAQIGANLGFYTLLAATRGYDVMAFEPSQQCVARLLHSLQRNGIQVVASTLDTPAQVAPYSLLEAQQAAAWAGEGAGGAGKKGGGGSLVQRRAKEAERLGRRAGLAALGAAAAAPRKAAAVAEAEALEEEGEAGAEGRRRKGAAWVFNNAASDAYATLPFAFMEDNPGASFIQWGGGKKSSNVDVGAGAWVGRSWGGAARPPLLPRALASRSRTHPPHTPQPSPPHPHAPLQW